jgi:hypothetical protein
MSFVTAGISLLGALALLAFERSFSGLVWLAFSLCWFIAAVVQRMRSDTTEPFPGRRLFRRFMRLMLFS